MARTFCASLPRLVDVGRLGQEIRDDRADPREHARVAGPCQHVQLPQVAVAALEVRQAFEAAPGVVDVDWSLWDAQTERRFLVDREIAGLSQVDPAAVVEALQVGLGGRVATYVSTTQSRGPIPVPSPSCSCRCPARR